MNYPSRILFSLFDSYIFLNYEPFLVFLQLRLYHISFSTEPFLRVPSLSHPFPSPHLQPNHLLLFSHVFVKPPGDDQDAPYPRREISCTTFLSTKAQSFEKYSTILFDLPFGPSPLKNAPACLSAEDGTSFFSRSLYPLFPLTPSPFEGRPLMAPLSPSKFPPRLTIHSRDGARLRPACPRLFFLAILLSFG